MPSWHGKILKIIKRCVKEKVNLPDSPDRQSISPKATNKFYKYFMCHNFGSWKYKDSKVHMVLAL